MHERRLNEIKKKAEADLLFVAPMDGILWASSAQTDMLVLLDEVERLNGRLEAVCDVVSDAAAFGAPVSALAVMEAVRGT